MSDLQQRILDLLAKLSTAEGASEADRLEPRNTTSQQSEGSVHEPGDYVKNLMREAAERKRRSPLPEIELRNFEDKQQVTQRKSTSEFCSKKTDELPLVELESRRSQPEPDQGNRHLLRKQQLVEQAGEAVNAFRGLLQKTESKKELETKQQSKQDTLPGLKLDLSKRGPELK